jgi:hypothetical protein
MDKLKEFFKNNDVRIGEGKDFTTTPPLYYLSLNEAFYNYFSTFREKKDSFHLVLDFEFWSRESLAFNFTGSGDKIVFSILGFHRFMELLLKDILRRINPFLAVKFLEKEEEVFKYLDKQINADEIKTIEFNETLKRFKYAFNHYKKSTEIYEQHLKNYECLISARNLQTMEILAEWRNRIMHNGSTLPNIYAYEYLVSQRLIPMIDEIVKAEQKYLENYLPHYYHTKTGINVMQEFLTVKFEHTDFKDKTKSNSLAFSLMKLLHLKEIGRTTFNVNIFNNESFYESYYVNPTGRAERFAETEKIHGDFFNLRECLCCGLKTMVVYRKSIEDIFSNKPTFISWFKCYNCDYSLKNNVCDPIFIGFTDEPIFATE